MSDRDRVQRFFQWEYAARDTIDVKRIYIDMTAQPGKPRSADVAAGVMLSQIVWHFLPREDGSPKSTLIEFDGYLWLVRSRDHWWKECRITEHQSDRILALLADGKEGKRPVAGLNLIVKEVHLLNGTPRVHIRLNFPVFTARWETLIEAQPSYKFDNVESRKFDNVESRPDNVEGSGKFDNVEKPTLYKDQKDIRGKEGRITLEADYDPEGDPMRQDLELTPQIITLWERIRNADMGKNPDLTAVTLRSYEILTANRLVAFWTSGGRDRSTLPLKAILLNVEAPYAQLDRLNLARRGLEDRLAGLALKFNLLADKRQEDRPYEVDKILIRFEDADRRLKIDGGGRGSAAPSPFPPSPASNGAGNYKIGDRVTVLNNTGADDIPY